MVFFLRQLFKNQKVVTILKVIRAMNSCFTIFALNGFSSDPVCAVFHKFIISCSHCLSIANRTESLASKVQVKVQSETNIDESGYHFDI